MSKPAIPCALEGEHAGSHGPGVYSSDFGPLCTSCYRTRQVRGLEGPDADPTFAGVPANLRATALYGAHRPNPLGQYMHIKKRRPTPRPREPYVELRSRDLRGLALHLTSEQRTPLLLQLDEGLTYDEIAERLRLPLVTVRERLRRARESIRRLRQGA